MFTLIHSEWIWNKYDEKTESEYTEGQMEDK